MDALKDLLPATLLSLLVLIGTFVGTVFPPSQGAAFVLFNPNWDRADILHALDRADVDLLYVSSVDGGYGVWSEGSGASERLKQAGAWLVLSPVFGEGCGFDREKPKSTFTDDLRTS